MHVVGQIAVAEGVQELHEVGVWVAAQAAGDHAGLEMTKLVDAVGVVPAPADHGMAGVVTHAAHGGDMAARVDERLAVLVCGRQVRLGELVGVGIVQVRQGDALELGAADDALLLVEGLQVPRLHLAGKDAEHDVGAAVGKDLVVVVFGLDPAHLVHEVLVGHDGIVGGAVAEPKGIAGSMVGLTRSVCREEADAVPLDLGNTHGDLDHLMHRMPGNLRVVRGAADVDIAAALVFYQIIAGHLAHLADQTLGLDGLQAKAVLAVLVLKEARTKAKGDLHIGSAQVIGLAGVVRAGLLLGVGLFDGIALAHVLCRNRPVLEELDQGIAVIGRDVKRSALHGSLAAQKAGLPLVAAKIRGPTLDVVVELAIGILDLGLDVAAAAVGATAQSGKRRARSGNASAKQSLTAGDAARLSLFDRHIGLLL